jgi:proteasome lid subunit RPN8/RPN11
MSPAPAKLKLPRTLHVRLIAHAEATPDVEICGLLIGSGELDVVVDDIVFAPNKADQPCTQFEIDPQVQFDCLRQLRGTARRIVGHFHSHPTALAAPSTHDLAMAHDPDVIWVIIGLRPPIEARAYVRPDPVQGFRAIDLVIC